MNTAIQQHYQPLATAVVMPDFKAANDGAKPYLTRCLESISRHPFIFGLGLASSLYIMLNVTALVLLGSQPWVLL